MSAAKLFVFATTQQTMQAEAMLAAAGLQGVLVLKPKGLLGDCGLALEVPDDGTEALRLRLKEGGLAPVGVYDRFDRERWEIVD